MGSAPWVRGAVYLDVWQWLPYIGGEWGGILRFAWLNVEVEVVWP